MGTEILQVVTDTDRRGAQVFVSDLEAALIRQGHSVRTVALAPGVAGGLDVPVLGVAPKSIATLRALRKEMVNASVVIAHGSTTLPACALSGTGTRVPFVYRQISDSRFWASSASRRYRVMAALSRASRVVALWSGSAQVLADHFGVASSKITVIANGVPPDRFGASADRGAARGLLGSLGLDLDRFTLLYVGALVAEKGVEMAVDALARDPETQLVVVGDGPERSILEQRAEQVAPGRAAFTGIVADVVPFYDAADAVVFPSRGGDSMPAVLIEAGLMATPCIATRIDAIPEVVVDGSTGLLIPPGDDRALSVAIAKLRADPQLVEQLGAAARRHCLARYSIDTVAAQWAELLGLVAAGR